MTVTARLLPLTNILVVDDQHAFFFDYIRRLESAMSVGEGSPMVPLLLDDLSQFANVHFGAEGRLMSSFEYPLRDMHARQHQVLREKLKGLRLIQHVPAIAMHLLQELHDWQEEHVENWDVRMGTYLNSRSAA